MYETLLYIATHLDYYVFHTDRARALKRELERWSTLPLAEQKDVGRVTHLINQFKSMFSNNPFLEQNGFLSGTHHPTEHPADITGLSAEAYFTEDWKPQTFHPKGTQQGDAQAQFYSDKQLQTFSWCCRKEGEEAAQKTVAQATAGLQSLKECFSHILCKSFHVNGSKYHSLNLLDIVVALLFHSVCAYYLVHGWFLSEFLVRYGLRFSDASQWELLRAGQQAAVLLFSLILLPGSIHLIVKAVYRLRMIRAFQEKEAKLKLLKTSLEDAERAEQWRAAFAEQIRKDRDAIAKEPGLCLANQASHAMLLHPQPPWADLIRLSDKPWRKYRKPGERQRFLLRLVLLLLILVFSL